MHPGLAGTSGISCQDPTAPLPTAPGEQRRVWQRQRHPPVCSCCRDEVGPTGSHVVEAPRLTPVHLGAGKQPGSLPLHDPPLEKLGRWVLPWGHLASVDQCRAAGTQTPCPSNAPGSTSPAALRPSIVGGSRFALQNLNSEKNVGKTRGAQRGLMVQVE